MGEFTKKKDFSVLIGVKRYYLTCIEVAERKRNARLVCQCECGNKITIVAYSFGVTRSCGCYRSISHKEKVNYIGDDRATILYSKWLSMRRRVNNPNEQNFKYYGGKGIKIAAEWDDFLVFKKWAIDNGYEPHLTLDRIDPNGNYEPSNCRWVTWEVQWFNKTNTRYVTFMGLKKNLKEWKNILGEKDGKILKGRLYKNITLEKVFKGYEDKIATYISDNPHERVE